MAHKKKNPYGSLFLPQNINVLLNDIIKSLKKLSEGTSRFIPCELDGKIFLIKICFYNISVPQPMTKPSTIIHQSEMEFRALQCMRTLLNHKNLDTIVRLYHVHTMDNLTKIIPNEQSCIDVIGQKNLKNTLCRYKHLIENNLALNKCSFLIMEQCDIPLSGLLSKYLENPPNFEILKAIIFQVIFTLYVIVQKYPLFHHYDLHTENILLRFDNHHQMDFNNLTYKQYQVGGRSYYVPYFGIIPKVIDFEYAVIPEENIESAATLDRLIMYQRPKNDFVLTLYWIYITLSFERELSPRLARFFHEIEPNDTYKKYEIYYIRKIEHLIPTYQQMLQSKAFKEYRKAPQTKQIIKKFTPI